MPSRSETGHAKNVATFEKMISFVEGFGEKYKPISQTAKLPYLRALFIEAKNVMVETSQVESVFLKLINKRTNAFKPLRKMSTRILASYTDVATDEDVEDVQGMHRKIQGTRAIPKDKPASETGNEQPVEGEVPEDIERSISVSQQSFDNLLAHFGKMIDRLKANDEYKPNEPELRVDALGTLLDQLATTNSAANTAATPYKNAVIARNTVLYQPKKGLVPASESVKRYVKSAYGYGTPEHRLVSGLVFTKPRKRRSGKKAKKTSKKEK